MTAQRYEASIPFEKKKFEHEERHFVFPSGEIGSVTPAVYCATLPMFV